MGTQIVSSSSYKRYKSLESYLRLKGKLDSKTLLSISYINGILKAHNIDGETAVALLQSYEEHRGGADDLPTRLSRFHKFLNSMNDRDDLIGTVKDLGLLSLEELEKQAVETGNWMPYMVRSEIIKKHNDKVNVDQEEESDE